MWPLFRKRSLRRDELDIPHPTRRSVPPAPKLMVAAMAAVVAPLPAAAVSASPPSANVLLSQLKAIMPPSVEPESPPAVEVTPEPMLAPAPQGLSASAAIPVDTLSGMVLSHDILRKATFTGELLSPAWLFTNAAPADAPADPPD